MDPVPPTSPPDRPRHLPLVLLGGVALALLVYRGYGPRFAARPTDTLPPAAVPKVDLNAADRAELLQLPGVGPTLADAILAHRQERGPFRSVDDLDAVKGVGGKTLDRLRPMLRADAGPAVVRAQAPDTVERLERPSRPSSPTGKLTVGDPPVDVNAATAEQLQRLPGVGPKLAERIVAERAVRPFASADDLRRVSGIGPKTVEKLRPLVVCR
jgi:competence protein ComEA